MPNPMFRSALSDLSEALRGLSSLQDTTNIDDVLKLLDSAYTKLNYIKRQSIHDAE